ncbi:efflux RND transporter periplasmic adaptor subunit [Actomonas aquatica]|uniref:Efflux RND transporter periplasmic adaptor subunit n=1 Tax=Actomonas aquatica TaxID=2866162 RepID=A0ABZ1C4J8_9BACT|nr:efflux RND transporter periplasmic adaptor subunit [Opitutus sp. WL0086]WRQ86494.1 efflux RND transporter periplasmic adaptor subunit [Opitutus sp. WL0086]
MFRRSAPLGPSALILAAALVLTACGKKEDPASGQADGKPAAEKSATTDAAKTDAAGDKKPGPNRAGPWGGGGQEEAVAVQTAPITRGPIAATLSFNSTLETESTVELFPQISGQVEELLVEEGDFVKTGDPLLQIDDRELRVDANEAQANLDLEKANFDRIQELFKRGLVNQQEFENARYSLTQRQLAFERAQIRLDHATVKAPFDGVVSEREVQVGARVGTGTKLFSLVSLQDMVAVVYAPGRYLTEVAKNQPAAVTSEFLPGQTYSGWVKRISPVIDPQSGTFKVTVGVSNPTREVLPGLFVKVAITTEERPNALLAPKRAIVYDGGGQYLFTVRDNKAVRIPLEAGFETPSTVEVRSGLSVGDPIIVLGQAGLKDGATVKVVDPDVATTKKPPVDRENPNRKKRPEGEAASTDS